MARDSPVFSLSVPAESVSSKAFPAIKPFDLDGNIGIGILILTNKKMALQAFVWAPFSFLPFVRVFGPESRVKGRQGGVEASRGWASRESLGSCKPARFLPPLAPPYKGGDPLGNHPRPSKNPHDFRKSQEN
jgi:hypothetical protein